MCCVSCKRCYVLCLSVSNVMCCVSLLAMLFAVFVCKRCYVLCLSVSDVMCSVVCKRCYVLCLLAMLCAVFVC